MYKQKHQKQELNIMLKMKLRLAAYAVPRQHHASAPGLQYRNLMNDKKVDNCCWVRMCFPNIHSRRTFAKAKKGKNV